MSEQTDYRYILTSSLDPIEKGQVFEAELPRHVTVYQWFSLERPASFTNSLMNLAHDTSDMKVIGAENAEFGPNNDVPVRLLRGIGALAAFHDQISRLISGAGGEARNPEWVGEGYKPHVTYVDGRALEEGEEATLKTIELIERDDESGLKVVRHVLPLKGRS